jgi:lysozyme
MLTGIDVSSWQGKINVRDMAVDFVIAKATEDVDYVNPYCDYVIQQCIESDKKWGFYHFAKGAEPEAEARYFIDNTRDYFGRGIPVLDFEGRAVNAWGAFGAKKFLDAVSRETDVKPLIYMSERICRSDDWSSVVLSDYGLWIAKYPNVAHPTFEDVANAGAGLDTGAWPFAAIWQFASDCRIAGYDGDLDGNIAFMDATAWDAYAGTYTSGEATETANFENEKIKVSVTFK